MISSIHEAALAYVRRGVPVIPTRVHGKEAVVKWQTSRPPNEDQVNASWYAYDYNLAIVPGDMGECVVDADGQDGILEWEQLVTAHGCAPTKTAVTPSGGLHIYFKGSLPPTVKKLAPHIDTRGRDSYVLVPPSVLAPDFAPVHYRWLNDLPAAPLPAWILERLGSTERVRAAAPADVKLDTPHALERARDYLRRNVPPVEGAGSDDAVYRLASMLKDLGLSSEAASNMLVDWTGFETAWIDEKVENAYAYGQNEPGASTADPAPVVNRALEWVETSPEAAALAQQAKEVQTAADNDELAGRGSDLVPERIDWLWPGYLARGKFHVLGGQKGAGKSTIAYSLAAIVSTGALWPDGASASDVCGDTLIWSGEDDAADTILPRFLASNGDAHRYRWIKPVNCTDGSKRAFDPAIDVDHLMTVAASIKDLRMIILDPIVSAVAADSHKNAETRRALQPLVDLAVDRKIALLGITHFTKGTQGRDPIERITGSLAFGAVPRMVLAAAKMEYGAPSRLVRIASNISAVGDGFEYDLVQHLHPKVGFEAQRAQWGAALYGSPLDLLEPKNESALQAMVAAVAELSRSEPEGLSTGHMERLMIKYDLKWAKVRAALGKTVEHRKAMLPNPEGSRAVGTLWYLSNS